MELKELIETYAYEEFIGNNSYEKKVFWEESNGIKNSVLEVDGGRYRYRVETLVFNSSGQLYCELKSDGSCRLPGGSIEPNLPNISQAIEEVKEEARMIVRNIRYSGMSYYRMYPIAPKWQADVGIKYDGCYSEIYTAEFDSVYRGHIEKHAIDSAMYNNGKFYNYSEIKNGLNKNHIEACENYYRKNVIKK